jgi:hypothetical protein
MRDAGSEGCSAAIQHWLREQEKGLASIQPKRHVKGKTKTPQSNHPKQLLNSPAQHVFNSASYVQSSQMEYVVSES